MQPPFTKRKKVLQLVVPCIIRATRLQRPAQALQPTLHKILHCFGRQCRGQGKIFVKLVRQTETQRLAPSSTTALLAQSTTRPCFKVPPGINSHVSHLKAHDLIHQSTLYPGDICCRKATRETLTAAPDHQSGGCWGKTSRAECRCQWGFGNDSLDHSFSTNPLASFPPSAAAIFGAFPGGT